MPNGQLEQILMLEWATVSKKQSVLEVRLLSGDSDQQDDVIQVPYSQLICSSLADRSSAGAVILKLRDMSLSLIVRSEEARLGEINP